MSTRTVVSYDDITLPYDPVDEPQPTTQPSPRVEQPPPAKKRKKNNQKGKNRANQNQNQGRVQQNKFTNGSGSAPAKAPQQYQQQQEEYDESMQDEEGYYDDELGEAEGGEEEESRELTHEEIWDDSALVYAWEAAMEEYEAFHGPEKDWKKEPVKKSPLWYNVPPEPSKKTSSASRATLTTTTSAGGVVEGDSKPLDFDTFVPTHDPSLYPPPSTTLPLDAGTAAAAHAAQVDYIPEGGVPGAMVSQDEAFQRALSATYWAGYWTAMYHAQKQFSPSQNVSGQETVVENDEDAEGEEEAASEEIQIDNEEEFVSAQR